MHRGQLAIGAGLLAVVAILLLSPRNEVDGYRSSQSGSNEANGSESSTASLLQAPAPASVADAQAAPAIRDRTPVPALSIRVVAGDQTAIRDAVVVGTRESPPRTADLTAAKDLEEYGIIFHLRTGDDGTVDIPLVDPVVCHVRVAGGDGVPSDDGPETIDLAEPTARQFTYRLPIVKAAAVVMADGVTVDHVRWDLGFRSAYRLGFEPKGIKTVRQGVGRRLQLPYAQVFAGVPAEAGASVCEVAIFHPRIGWFRHSVPMTSPENVVATVVPVPSSGVGKPCKVVVNCESPTGEACVIEGLMLSGQMGTLDFPRIVDVERSGVERVLPAGRYTVTFHDPALHRAFDGPQAIELTGDQVIGLRMKWTSRSITVRAPKVDFVRSKDVAVTVEANGRMLYRQRYEFVRGAALNVSIPKDRDVVVGITVGKRRASLPIKAGDTQDEYSVDL